MTHSIWGKLKVTSVMALSVMTLGTVSVSAAGSTDYADVSEDNVHYEGIMELTEQGVLKGYEDNSFKPWQNVNRTQAALILADVGEYVELDNIDKTLKVYDDVDSDSLYADEIAKLTEAGVFQGDDDGNFNPWADITRQQTASVLVEAMNLESDGDQVNVNLDNVSAPHQGSVQTLADLEITDQLDDFRAYESITRAAVATMIYEGQSAGDFNLSLMHFNDNHARVEPLPKMVTAAEEQREDDPESLLLNAGDAFSGTLYFNEFHGKADMTMFNLMDVDAMAFGNHEFDLGDKEGGHESLSEMVEKADFPFLGSNVNFSDDEFMSALDTEKSLARNPEDGKSYDSIIKKVDGEEVGIFGLTTEDTTNISSPTNVTFDNYLDTAEQAVADFEEAGVDKIVAVTHIGYDSNPDVGNDLLLGEVDGLDVIVGGHSHTALEEPKMVDEDADGDTKDPTVIVQAGQYANYLGTLDVEFDKDGVVQTYSGKLLNTDNYDADSDAKEKLQPFKDDVEERNNAEIGATAEKALPNPRQNEASNDSVRANETALGNLITDAMLAKTREKFPETDFAVQNGGGIRTSIDKGPITEGEVIDVLPFGNDPVIADLKGSEIKSILETSVSQAPKENGGFLHVSGMKYKYDSSKGVGDRIEEMKVKRDGEYVDIKSDEMYRVTTNSFTGQGGDGLGTFAEAYEDDRVQDTGESDWGQLRDYMVDDLDGNVNPEREGRIEDVAGQTNPGDEDETPPVDPEPDPEPEPDMDEVAQDEFSGTAEQPENYSSPVMVEVSEEASLEHAVVDDDLIIKGDAASLDLKNVEVKGDLDMSDLQTDAPANMSDMTVRGDTFL